MKLKEFDITLDIKKTNQVPYFEVVGGDFETNVLNIALTDGTPYSLDELSAEIVFAKPDRTTVVQDKNNGVVIEDNIIKCTLASNTIAVSGTVFAEVRVLQDAKVLTSPRFKFYVRKPILNDKTVASSNQFPMLVQAIEDAKEAATNAQEAAQEAGEHADRAQELADTFEQTTLQEAGEHADRAQGIADTFENTTLPAAIQSVEQAVEEQIGIAKGHADRAQELTDTFEQTTLPAAITAVEAAGQAKVDLAEEQAIIAINKAKDALDSAAAALSSEQNARSTVDEFLPIAISQVEAAGQAKVDLAKAEADRAEDIIQEAEQDVLPELRQAIEDGIETKSQLGGSIQEAGEAKGELDGSISSAGVAKTQLDGSISSANGIKSQLDGSIAAAGQAKELLDESIATGDLVAFRYDFESHLNDYATYKDSNNLKIVKVEKELNDYKAAIAGMNPNHEPKQKVNDYGIVSLPKNATNGQVSVSVKGVTATNLIINGDFTTDVSSWTLRLCTLTSVDGVAEMTGQTNTDGLNRAFQAHGVPIGHKIYARADVKATTNLAGIGIPTAQRLASHTGNGEWEKLSFIRIISEYETVAAIALIDNRTSDWDTVYFDNVFVVDLTATFGAENEPTKEQCDQIFANWFDGTKSTISASRLKSVGKNLFDKSKIVSGEWVNASTGVISSSSVRERSEYMKIQPNTTYVRPTLIQGKSDSNRQVAFFDGNKNFISGITLSGSSENATFITPGNAVYVITSWSIDTKFNAEFLQIEQGLTATEYEPYKESTVYINGAGELRSFPNGTKDEISIGAGGTVKTKRVSDDLQPKDLTWTRHSGADTTNYWSISTTLPQITDINKIRINNYNGIGFTSYSGGFVEFDGLSYRIASGGSTSLYLKIPKSEITGDIDDVKAKAWLQSKSVSLNYQLATPVETPAQVSGTLVSYPSGTVYIEPFVADAGIYTDKMEVLYSDLPIKALEKISKVDFDTGLETELDITAAVIAEDKLSFTHPDLTSGDIVFFVYEHGAEGTIPETEISYYDSRYVIKGEDDKFYQWEIEAKLVEGVITPSIKLVEV